MKNKKKIILLVLLLLVLSGCTSYIKDGKVIEESVIYLSTSWGSLFGGDWLSSIFNGLIVYPIAQMLNFFSETIGVGPVISLVIVTTVIKVVLFLATRKSTMASQRMQSLQPEIQRIQDKYKDKKDTQSMQRQQMEIQKIYKENDISPFGSIGVMFLQFPLLIGMYQAVQRSDALAHGSFFGLFQLTEYPSAGFATLNIVMIIIFILMIASQFVSMKLPQWLSNRKLKVYEKPASNSSMNMMTYGMIAMISFMAYSWPISMSFYWMLNSLLQIGQTLLVQKMLADDKK